MTESDHSTLPPAAPGTVPRPWLAIALLAVLAALCVSLGFWQLGRAGEAGAAAARFETARALPPATLRTGDDADDTLRFRSVTANGRYVPERQILLDNIVRNGMVGYEVLTPFAPDDGGPWLLVNRGWVRADPDRRVLPSVAALDTDARRIDGVLDRLPSPGLRMGDPPAREGGAPVIVMSFPTLAAIEEVLGRRLYGYQLRLDAGASDGYVRDWQAPGLAPDRHLGYAMQWWLFGSIAGGAALVIGARQVRRRN